MNSKLEQRLSEIQARADKASKGPWFVHPITGVCNGDPKNDNDNYPLDSPEDDDFIAHSRTDIETLLKIVRAQDASITRYANNTRKADFIVETEIRKILEEGK